MRGDEPRLTLAAGIQVAIPPREAAVRDLDSDPVASEEHVAGRPQVDLHLLELVGPARDAHDAVAKVERSPVGRDVTQPGDPVG